MLHNLPKVTQQVRKDSNHVRFMSGELGVTIQATQGQVEGPGRGKGDTEHVLYAREPPPISVCHLQIETLGWPWFLILQEKVEGLGCGSVMEGLPGSHKAPGASPSSKTEGVKLDINRKSHIQEENLQVIWALGCLLHGAWDSSSLRG